MKKPQRKKAPRKSGEILIDELDPAGWVEVPTSGGMRVYKLWEDPKTGASFCILDVPKGAGIPIRHRHASNQFMYCIKGTYEYSNPGLTLNAGSFYMNPKGHPHGPTVAKSRCLLLEAYDGPHYFEVPSFHTKKTVGRIATAASRRTPRKQAAVRSKRAAKRPAKR